MSSGTVRNAFRAAWPVRLPALRYVETLNVPVAQDSLTDTWATLDFQALEDRPVALGPSCYRETGLVTVTIFSPTNAGDSAAITAAQSVRDAFIQFFDVGGHLRVTQIDPPLEVDGGDLRGAWWVVAVPISYQFDHHT